MRFQIAFGKAHGALALGIGSRALMNRAEQQPYFIAAATAAIGGALVPVPGGLLILDPDPRTVAAVCVSGDRSDNDEAAPVAGIRPVGRAPSGKETHPAPGAGPGPAPRTPPSPTAGCSSPGPMAAWCSAATPSRWSGCAAG